MGFIHFIRHGQASFASDHYDLLSDVGRDQAAVLGDHLARYGPVFDAVYSGPMDRQIETARIVLDRAGRDPADPIVLSEFKEYDWEGVFFRLLPRMAAGDPELAALAGRMFSDGRALEKVFIRVMSRWISGSDGDTDMESWDGFTTRVESGLWRVIRENGPKKTMAVFTSGGVIAVVLRRVLGLSDDVALGLNWQTKNASITTFLYSGDRIALSSFNTAAHLERTGRPELITFR